MSERFRDRLVTARSFTDEVLVHCPRCSGRAVLAAHASSPCRLVCSECGHTADFAPTVVSWPGNQGRSELCDPFDLGLRLHLQVPCCGEVLWAFNHAHVDFLESYVDASLRERYLPEPPAPPAYRMTMAAKLPAWIKRAKNRDHVLRALARLRAR
ncbi:hypothetical protein [Allokutzneria sp. NRRL B-24872]|uniref:hypothetical protein n=1 Tax=Allokutzneria sp. NRRL B-24872 TaxID=1137961 RepID=UPI000A3A3F5A|nr:hypothetical protein [Allokutzneria sp. NRRL B-24872]